MRITLVLMMLLPITGIYAQTFQVIARNTPDSVVLRWAPLGSIAWDRYNVAGYKVERLAMHRDLVGRPKPEQLNQEIIRPWTLEQFQANVGPETKYLAIAGQALYGQQFAPSPKIEDLKTIADAASEVQMRYSFAMLSADLDVKAATALGLRWVDRDLAPNVLYLYRVIALDPERPDTAMIAVNRSMGPDLIPKGPQVLADEEEGKVTLKWMNDIPDGAFTAFWIERETKSDEWVRLNASPYLQTFPDSSANDHQYFYTDTALEGNYVTHRYRLRGITAFGETSEPSPVITAMGRDRTAPPNPEMKGVEDRNGQLVVEWEQPERTPDLEGFRVEKAYASTAAYEPLHEGLLSSDARSFTDPTGTLRGENHYRVWAVDTAGNGAVSLSGYGFLVDSIPPADPTGLSGTIDSSGVVNLHWNMGQEEDIQGYRVFYGNQIDHEFTNITPEPHRDTTFIHEITLNTLTRKIHFRVVAVDRNFNHSGMSEMLTLLRPDTIRPVPPLFKDYSVSDSSVTINMIPSSSPDVEHYELMRKAQNATEWTRIAQWPAANALRTYGDMGISGPQYYSYRISAIDSAGNISKEQRPLDVRVHARLRAASIRSLDAVWDADTKKVTLEWSAPDETVKHYVLYRAKD
ncbi:MAG: fibronectin type III domain-containing protein, partial [Bacteroidota bacterium]|nr:fibronectin type III domain-containing protein [Bacteroidota bacterium]